jgi:CBS domain containing-hemolysin-like protein
MTEWVDNSFPTDAPADSSRLKLLGQGVLLAFVFALVSLFEAALASAGCQSDGSFSLSDPSAQPSAYCQATHLPGVPDTLHSGLVLGIFFAVPALIVLGATALAVATQKHAPLRWSAVAAVAGLIAGLVSVTFAHVGYSGF